MPPESRYSPPRHPYRGLIPRGLALRTLWDLRWHGENKAVASNSQDPQVSACPNCKRFCSQAHVLCDCPGTMGANISVNRLPPGPMLDQGRKFQTLLSTFNQPLLMARRWSGPWDRAAIAYLQPEMARCTGKQIKAVLRHIGRVTNTTAAACWSEFSAMAKDLNPPPDNSSPPAPLADRQTSTLEWDPRQARTTVKHRLPTPRFVRMLTDLVI